MRPRIRAGIGLCLAAFLSAGGHASATTSYAASSFGGVCNVYVLSCYFPVPGQEGPAALGTAQETDSASPDGTFSLGGAARNGGSAYGSFTVFGWQTTPEVRSITVDYTFELDRLTEANAAAGVTGQMYFGQLQCADGSFAAIAYSGTYAFNPAQAAAGSATGPGAYTGEAVINCSSGAFIPGESWQFGIQGFMDMSTVNGNLAPLADQADPAYASATSGQVSGQLLSIAVSTDY
ncbi:MAG: hypothetical protein ACYDAY_00855 [Candidatus Dormibacteria bacterium]